MPNPNPKMKFKKGDPKVTELGKKGGEAKKGYKSFKVILRELLTSGEIDPYEFVKAQALEAMNGNSGISKILWEYDCGKVKDEIELTELTPKDITVTFVSPPKAKP